MPVPRRQAEQYSGLEVVTADHNPNDKFLANRPTPYSQEKQTFFSNAAETEGLQNSQIYQQNEAQSAKPKWSRKKKILVAGIVAAIVIVVAVVGGVCGALLSKKDSSNQSSEPNPSPGVSDNGNSSGPAVSMIGDAKVFGDYSSPTVSSWGYPHMDLIITNGTANPLWLTRSPNASSITDWNVTSTVATNGPFTFLGGYAIEVTHSLTSVARGGNNTDVFAIGGGERGLFQKWQRQTSTWGPNALDWYRADSAATVKKTMYSPPGLGTWSEDRIDIFAIGQGGELWQYYWDPIYNGWQESWQAFGGDFVDDFAPTVVSWGVGRYDLFLVCSNNTLGYKYYDGEWSPSLGSGAFENLGGQLTSRPSAVAAEVGRLDIFARGGDAGLWHLSFDGRWGNWTRLGAESDKIKGDPSAVVLGNQIHVLAWGEDGSLLKTAYNWKQATYEDSSLSSLGTELAGAPTATTDGVNVEVFAHLTNNRIGWKYFSDGDWKPEGQTMAGLWQYTANS